MPKYLKKTVKVLLSCSHLSAENANFVLLIVNIYHIQKYTSDNGCIV